MGRSLQAIINEFITQVDSRDLVIDLAGLIGVAAFLAALYYLIPIDIQRSLAFNHRDPSIQSVWTHVLVHQHRPGDGHLIGNLKGYFQVVIPAWLLCLTRGQRRRFWLLFGSLLVLGPPVFAGFSYLILDIVLGVSPRFDRGFSAVVGGLAGVLLILAFEVIDEEMEPHDGYQLLLIIGSVIAASVALNQDGFARIAMFVASGGCLAAYAVGIATGKLTTVDSLAEWARENPLNTVLLGVGLFFAMNVFVGSLPGEWIREDSVVNIFGHAAGLVFGTLATWIISDGFPESETVPPIFRKL